MKVLIVATNVWPTAARISISLAQVGFFVATLSPARSLARTVRAVSNHYTYNPWDRLGSIGAAIRAWGPDLLVCTDDRAVKHLHDLHARESRLAIADSHSLVRLIETSLGNPAWFPSVDQKSEFMTIASQAGVRCPTTLPIADDRDGPLLSSMPYPLFVKADGTWGGRGVRFVENEAQARDAIIELSLPLKWPDRIKRTLAKSIGISKIRWRHRRTICLQQRISGSPANRAVLCREGRVLAGVSVEALETQYESGPASIVRVIEHSEMTATAKSMVERLQLSGLVGFDFILDPRNNAWLIEMNPRVTPICHLRLADGTSLPSTMFSEMTGQQVAPKAPIASTDTIVLFPGGLRKPSRSIGLSSIYLSSFHDVPWDEPELVQACINDRPRNGLRKHASKMLRIHGHAPKMLGN